MAHELYKNVGGGDMRTDRELLELAAKAIFGFDEVPVQKYKELLAERDALAAKLAEREGQTDNLLSACHRLALELECLLLDTKDSASVSRWWDSAMAALDGWHKVKDLVSAEQPVNAQPLETIKRLSFCAQTTGGTAGRDEGLCAAIGEAEKAIAAAEAALAEPQPDADGWIPWAGGECPLPRREIHEVLFRDGEISQINLSPHRWDWSHGNGESDIIAYRVEKL